ncbi:uncharacterized protein PITG_00931 [Phytophthora infestans T30-4]|uniref:STI1 domain-containing protein n=1 Tax=Phytophthora infestans (strain T30-4) TaxID=403677 RepID=D0MS16_PHYIT|nr:uncharacterized protein PITG_00931 [Phytophthora infestans T30-4]EEY58285.1 conserved hypothetical protein [Phytophthora infestans T30-4]|eukprot:XP_002909471.1 conserved hypothetical protein [Phytophthora infestans T30-4]
MDSSSKATLFNALTWVDALKTRDGVNSQQVDAALTSLTEAFGMNVHDAEQKRQLAVNGDTSFDEIFAAGLKALNLETGAPGETKSMADEDPVVKKHPELWKKWLAKLESKGFFKDAAPGSGEYATRTNKALAKFKEKFGDVKPDLYKEEKEAKAEEVKAQGNAALSRQDYEGAAKLYREALQLSSDGPSSHIYHSNLAAALMYLGKHTEVIDHCEHSIALQPSYVKAYSRMGSAQVQLQDFDGAIDTYRRGLEVDSTNAACRDGLADAERKRRQMQTTPAASASAGGAGGMPDLSNLASMLGGGGGGGLAGLMNNPQMMQMAQNMMQNPQMMQMAQNMMQNPDMLNNLMGGLGGAGGDAPAAAGGAASGMPDMSGLMNSPELVAARSDPDLADFFRDVDSEGPSAAMRHMSNPKVSQLMQNVMSGMQG